LFFTTGILIAFFCFSFYLIWNQFLKKDTRLSTGLQVLRKKISDLENLSLTVEALVDRKMSMVNERTRKMEALLKKTKEVSDKLEENIELAKALSKAHLSEKKESFKPPEQQHLKQKEYKLKKETPRFEKEQGTKIVAEKKEKQIQFGKSPFNDLEFIENNKNPVDFLRPS